VSEPGPPAPAGARADDPHAALTQLGIGIKASDIFVFRRVANARFVHVGGLGRGESWAGDIELDADTDPLASQVRVERPVRIRHQETQHVFGPYYAVAAAAVRLSHDVLVIFGATAPESDFDRSATELSEAAKQATELVDAATPAKQLADELEVLHACQDLATRNRPGGSVEDAMSHAATVAADVLGCEIALTWLPDGRLHRHVTAELPARDAPVEHFAPIMRRLWEERETLPRCAQDATEQPLAAPLDPASGVRSYFVVPIDDPPTALLLVAHTRVEPRGFTGLCVGLGTRLAATAGAGLATATLREQLLHAVAEETSAREELARVNTELGRAALHDPLTGLPNRVLLQRHVERLGCGRPPARSAVTQSQPGPVLLYIDLDDFKSVNDEHGHAVGDGVLVEFARRLRESCRPNDVAARLAGDEFALLMVDPLTEEHAVAVANRVVRAASLPFLVADRVVAIGASVGVAAAATVRRGEDDQPALETLLHSADLAMYRAKTRGRGRAEIYTPRTVAPNGTQSRRGTDDPALGRGLRDALNEGGLRLRYRPKVDLLSGEVLELEALIQWPQPSGATLGTVELAALAERTGLIGPLDEWALHEACRQAGRWDRHATDGTPGPVVAVNIRPAELVDPDFFAALADIMSTSGLQPARLSLEIAETGMKSDRTELVSALHRLHDTGLHLTMDGFGAGASSLTLMRRLPLDWVKIDEELIGRVDVEPADAVLVRLVIESAHSLGLQVCAEGVHRHAQLEQLAAIGCDAAQGDLLGAAVEPALVDNRTRVVNTIITPAQTRPLLGSRGQLTTLVDAAGKFTYVCAESISMLGYHPSELVGTAAMDLVAPEYRDRVLGPFLSNDGSGITPSHPLLHKNGTAVWMESTHQTIRDPETLRMRQVIATSVDVSARVRAEAELADRAQRLQGAFDSAPHGAVVLTPQGTVLEVNTALLQLLDQTKAEMLGSSFHDFIDGGGAPALGAMFQGGATENHDEYTVTEKLVRADGQPVAAEFALRAVRANGRPAYVVGQVKSQASAPD